ncbi:MAG: primosomal protein N' [Oscillospiraceae bacterium]|nr:primosomal protein N' [Oscillospiraceae bacterium]
MNTESVSIAEIGISGASVAYDKRYSYIIPDELSGTVSAGKRVIVPFGRGSRKRIGIVLSVSECSAAETQKCKCITSVIDSEPVIGGEMQKMLEWLHDMTLCTYYDAFRALIPPGLSVNFTEKYSFSEADTEQKKGLSPQAADLYASFSEVKNRREQEMMISAAFDGTDKAAAEELLSKGLIVRCDEVRRRVKDETLQMIHLSEGFCDHPELFKLTPKQKKIAEVLEENGAASVKELCYLCNVTGQVIKNMLKSGAAESFEYEVIRPSEAKADSDPDDIVLTDEQQAAYNGISSLIDSDKPDCALLFGVTGSGKTSVFAKLIKHTLDIGKNVIMMIPEISLTPQTVSRFQSLFGDMVSVIHSSLSMTARLNEYKRIRSGGSRIVVGTRSAVFAPIDNIGLIIMDEEGEMTYKSETSPRYSARDAAKMRCVYHNAVLLLASATPSIESFYNAERGRYKLFELKNRYAGNPLPSVEIIDMSEEELCGTSGIFSAKLVNELNANLSRGEQSILLLNRRGYYTFISCTSCREPVKCPNCSIPLTYHKTNNRLICHYCGFSEDMLTKCPCCGSEKLKMTGLGTQKLEDEISDLFPSARILRMDADTTYSRYAYERSFKAFENGEYDIMLGTQMIAKGLDFPNVTLVGVLSVDKALFCGDFRSYERTFSLITQVVGRGGRSDKAGRAYIQTCVPEHYVINLAAQQDYKEFYRQESALRKALTYPPYCDICVAGFSSVNDSHADDGSKAFLGLISDEVDKGNIRFPLRVLGPARCVFERINGRFRYRIIIKCRNTTEFREFISEIRLRFLKMKEYSDVQLYIDINGDIGL